MMLFPFVQIFFVFYAVASAWGLELPPGQRQPNFFDTPNVCRGWYCYEDPQATPESPESEKRPLTVQPLPPTSTLPFTGVVDWQATWNMPPEQLKTLINDALSWAQQNPTDEDRMVTYLKLQGVAMRRSKRFQEAWAEAILKYPLLDETTRRAPSLAATSLEVVTERTEREKAIAGMKEDMGIIYFFSPDCPYCEKEKTILSSFLTRWDWKHYTAIDITSNPELAARFEVQVVPDIWVVGLHNGEILQRRLKSGLAEYADLERGLLKTWKQWFAGEQYERPDMSEQLVDFSNFVNSTPNADRFVEVKP